MKFATLFAFLAAAVHGSEVELVNRELLVTEQFHVSAATVQDDPAPAPFVITFDHNAFESGTRVSEVRLYLGENSCPHGDAGASESVPGVSVTSKTEAGDTLSTEVEIAVIPTGGPWGIDQTVKQNFCVWFGLGDGTKFYGFYEVQIESQFVFDGSWTCTGFKTQAYNPITGKSKKTITAKADLCADMELPLRPGKRVCIDICPDDADYEIKDPLESLFIGKGKCNEEPCPSEAAALAEFNGVDVTDSANGYYFEDEVDGNCVKATFLMDITYFPTVKTDDPKFMFLHVTGDAKFNLVSRRLASDRQLQESGDGDVAQVSGDIQFPVEPADESSARSAITGAAAAVALGAALLI